MEPKAKTFPLLTTETWLDELEEAVKYSTAKNKRDFIFQAVAEKIQRTMKDKK